VPETLDIDDRAEFYDATGATLDMVVTHLLQVAAEIAMEPPGSLEAGELLKARESVIGHFRPIDPTEVVLGQYEGYRDVEHVAADSQTDTFIAARMRVDTERWQGVPFLMRTGKRLAASEQRVTLVLRRPSGGPVDGAPPTAIGLSLKGAGELEIEVVTKRPGLDIALTTGAALLPLSHGDGPDLPAYATLIRDVLKGDRSLFTSSEGLAAAWRTLAPLLDHRPEVVPYAQGSWGPEAAQALPGADGWHLQREATPST
jgi:glucose-6-phosphate 1-dehydrogenase